MIKHTIVHFEIPADDVRRAIQFYSRLFAWQFSAPPGNDDYWLIQVSEGEQDLGGGLMKRQDPSQVPVNYVQVESVVEYAARVEELGGQVIVPKMPVPGMGWFAQCKDTEGNIFALWESDASAA